MPDDPVDKIITKFSDSLKIKSYINSIRKNDNGRYYCTVENCNKSYTRSNDTADHISKLHTVEPKKFKCDFEDCKVSCADISALNKHKKTVHTPKEFICTEVNCNAIFNDKKLFTKHKLEHELVCKICQEKFTKKSSLIRHIDVKHKDKVEFIICPFEDCDKKRDIKGFSSYENMKSHVLNYHVKLCEICWKAFNSDKAFSKHVCRSS